MVYFFWARSSVAIYRVFLRKEECQREEFKLWGTVLQPTLPPVAGNIAACCWDEISFQPLVMYHIDFFCSRTMFLMTFCSDHALAPGTPDQRRDVLASVRVHEGIQHCATPLNCQVVHCQHAIRRAVPLRNWDAAKERHLKSLSSVVLSYRPPHAMQSDDFNQITEQQPRKSSMPHAELWARRLRWRPNLHAALAAPRKRLGVFLRRP